jgi:hypothetical protein
LAVALVWVAWALWRADRNPAHRFRLVQLVSDSRGFGDKYALAYVVAMIIGSWLVWFAAAHNRLTEWLLVGYLGAFVAGAAFKTGASAKERIEGSKGEEGGR